LNSLTLVGGDLTVLDNASLAEFCGLYPLLAADGLAGGYSVLRNRRVIKPSSAAASSKKPETTLTL
jgi:hypothetical protein